MTATTQTSPDDDNIVDVDGGPPPNRPEVHFYGLALVFMAPALGGFLYGYDIGATSFVLAMIRDSRDHDVWWHNMPSWQQGLLVSALALGGLIGSHIVLVYLSNSIGRRKEMRIAAALYIVGAMLNVMSGTMLALTGTQYYDVGIGFVTVLLGRILYGAGVGFVMHGAPTYMAEMSPSHVRGALVSAKATVIVFGILVGMLMGDLLSDDPDHWPVGAVPMLFLTFKIPRSKRWLLMKGYRTEARESMQFVYKGDVEDEFDRMASAMDNLCCHADVPTVQDDATVASFYSNVGGDPMDPPEEDPAIEPNPSLLSPRYRTVMVIALGLLLSQQLSGAPSVLSYSRVLFQAAGWQGHASVFTVVIMGLTSMCTVFLVDRVGRKVLLLICCGVIIVSPAAMAYGFWGEDENNDTLTPLQKQFILYGMFAYIAGYQIGYGPMTWTVLSELFPTEVRGAAMAVSVETYFVAKFVTQLTFPIVLEEMGWGSTFILFTIIATISMIFVARFVPETKGLTLEQIQIQLQGMEATKSFDATSTGSGRGGGGGDNDVRTKQLANPLLELEQHEQQQRREDVASQERPDQLQKEEEDLRPIV